MATQVFKRTETRFGGAYPNERGLLTPNKGLTGVLLQNLSLQHNRRFTRIYDIGTAGQPRNVFYVGGPTEGQLQVGHVAGPAVAVEGFLDSFSDLCEAETNTIQLTLAKGACLPAGSAAAAGAAAAAASVNTRCAAQYCVITQFGLNVDSQSLLTQLSSTLQFTGLTWGDSTTG